jgi:hypothetical protein
MAHGGFSHGGLRESRCEVGPSSGVSSSAIGARKRLAVSIVAAAIIVGASVDCDAARWYEDYERAVELIKGGQCSREAIQLLGAAVVDRKKPKRNARTIAVKTVDYLPYYQLARAHLACGEAESALHYVEESRKRKVADTAALDDLERRVIELQNSKTAAPGPEIDLDELSALAREAQDTITRAISASERINSRRGTDWLANFFKNNQDQLAAAQEDLKTAKQSLNEGTLRQDRTAIQNAESFASRALVVFTSLESEAAALEPPEPTARPVVARATPRPTPTPRTVAAPTQPPSVPSPRPTLGVAASQPETQTATTPGIPESLSRAAADFAHAGYDDVVSGLTPESYSSIRQQAAAHLLRAAAHFALYCLDGRRDDERLGLARADVARSLELDSSLLPDPTVFSPEFVDLYR